MWARRGDRRRGESPPHFPASVWGVVYGSPSMFPCALLRVFGRGARGSPTHFPTLSVVLASLLQRLAPWLVQTLAGVGLGWSRELSWAALIVPKGDTAATRRGAVPKHAPPPAPCQAAAHWRNAAAGCRGATRPRATARPGPPMHTTCFHQARTSEGAARRPLHEAPGAMLPGIGAPARSEKIALFRALMTVSCLSFAPF
jgi:hypothetical protein